MAIPKKEVENRFDKNFCNHPDVIIADYDDPYPFLQNLALKLSIYGIRLTEITLGTNEYFWSLKKWSKVIL